MYTIQRTVLGQTTFEKIRPLQVNKILENEGPTIARHLLESTGYLELDDDRILCHISRDQIARQLVQLDGQEVCVQTKVRESCIIVFGDLFAPIRTVEQTNGTIVQFNINDIMFIDVDLKTIYL